MPLLTVQAAEKNFGPRVLFDKLDFALEAGERVGLIGANGAGKTSLFKLITGELVPDAGAVSVQRNVKVGVLAQDPVFDPDNTVMDEAELAFAELHRLSHELKELEHDMGTVEGVALEKILEKYQDTQHDFELAGGYAWRHKLEATLHGVGLEESFWEQKVNTLSGGSGCGLALAKLLISEPDVMLLDEPTNHLDLVAIEWLENYLLDFRGATLLISHDRYLLDRLATRIVWLTRSRLQSYPGNYSAFSAQKELQELSQKRSYEEQQADIEKQKEFVRRFGAGQRAREAKGREKRLNRLLSSDQMVESVGKERNIHLSLNTDQRAGDRVLTVRELAKAYDNRTLWREIGFEVKRGERIGVIGPNGSGKTTLLETLIGKREADEGDIRWGANLRIGYYDQKLDDFDPENTVTEEVRAGVEGDVKDQDLRNVLGTLLFRGDDAEKQISLLSGGERARVALAILLLDKPNVLVLDEPTNHLDIASREALEGTLREFPGTTFFVSHDRFFLDRVSQRLLVLTPPAGIVDFEGNYTAWQAKLAEKERAAAEAEKERERQKARGQKKGAAQQQQPKGQAKAQKNAAAKDNPYLRPFGRLELKEIERQITETEIELAECQARFAEVAKSKSPGEAKRLQGESDRLTKKLKELEAEYYLREG